EAMAAGEGLPAIIVNPTTPIGPRDIRPTPTGRILLDAARGRIPAFVDTGLNFAHVDDIAEGHLLAFEKGRIGERYILGGDNVHLHELLATVAKVAGRRPPRIRLPRRPLYPLAFGAEAFARFTGKEPLLTVDGLRLARYHMFFTSAKAVRELGYRSRPYQEGVVDALAWFRQAGYLPWRWQLPLAPSRSRCGSTCCSGAAVSGSPARETTVISCRRPRAGRASSPSCQRAMKRR